MQKNVTVETIAAYHARFESVDTHGHVGEMMGQFVLHHKTSLQKDVNNFSGIYVSKMPEVFIHRFRSSGQSISAAIATKELRFAFSFLHSLDLITVSVNQHHSQHR